ncbi:MULTISPECIES: carboxymuconolactone decarboxylase family protein [Pseudofrankia]|uniref:carboxymuconolactone decarboxylase family protein n=1 Tax=Pseudofrankia TaxID=2994363 RepID=UPI000234D8BD|nr:MULTISPECIES: carboxymuconolactone decarboxylase family protein [Pseudofrankia]OHV30895.1 carboxymuconolactone decarboxylase [Pseudofrankia sp. EUN1h]
MARIPPIPRTEWPPELTDFIASYRSAVRGDRPEEGRQGGSNLFGTLARYPQLARAFLAFNGHLLYGSALSARQRELLILRVASLRRCDYEWAQHSILGKAAGLQPAEIDRIAQPADMSGWSATEQALLKAADELVTHGAISGETWNSLAGEFDDRQLMDVVFTVGTYELVAMALRSFGVEPEADLVPHLPGSW